MADRDDHDHQAALFDHADDPIVPYAIRPQIALVTAQGLPSWRGSPSAITRRSR
jgi:hypothetical protein